MSKIQKKKAFALSAGPYAYITCSASPAVLSMYTSMCMYIDIYI